MGNNLFQVLLATIKAKIVPLVTKLKMWTSWSYIRTRMTAAIRDFFNSIFDVRPRNKKDYYEAFGWLISRRLAFAVVVVIGVLSLYYLMFIRTTLTFSGETGIKSYSYDSLMLRFAKERVRILGKGDYLAYEGQVADGAAEGYGTLYNREGEVVYQGNFSKSCYEGRGTSYYKGGNVEYTGDFSENLFHGTGKQYRGNGSILYEGEFDRGKRNGQGKLFDNGNNLIYTGSFLQDELVYSELLGKTSADIPKLYSGKRTIFEGESEFGVVMEDIGAMYAGNPENDNLDDSMEVEQVLVLSDTFRQGGITGASIEELREYFGPEVYEGNSVITMAESIAWNWMIEHGGAEGIPIPVSIDAEYSDYRVVREIEAAEPIYIHAFCRDGLLYSFLCPEQGNSFIFYTIEKEEGGGAS